MYEYSALVVSARPEQTLVVDVSFKYRNDKLIRVAVMVAVRLDLNLEVIMDTRSCYRAL